MANTSASLARVLKNKEDDSMPVHPHDIRKPDGTFEQRLWSRSNTPVLFEQNEVLFIIHPIVDVTEFLKLKKNKKLYNTVSLQTMLTGAKDMAFLRAKGVECYRIGPMTDTDMEDGPKGFGAHSDQRNT